jgi:hypothetical protein
MSGPLRCSSMKKTETKKSHDTVPLISFLDIYVMPELYWKSSILCQRNSKIKISSRRYPKAFNAAQTLSGKMAILQNTKNMDDCLNKSKTTYEAKYLNYPRFFFQLLYCMLSSIVPTRQNCIWTRKTSRLSQILFLIMLNYIVSNSFDIPFGCKFWSSMSHVEKIMNSYFSIFGKYFQVWRERAQIVRGNILI